MKWLDESAMDANTCIQIVFYFILFMQIKCEVINPVIMSPSLITEFSRCFLDEVTPDQQREMFQCFIQCLQNPCCRAVNITNCQQSYISAQGMDFLKMVSEGLDISSKSTDFVKCNVFSFLSYIMTKCRKIFSLFKRL